MLTWTAAQGHQDTATHNGTEGSTRNLGTPEQCDRDIRTSERRDIGTMRHGCNPGLTAPNGPFETCPWWTRAPCSRDLHDCQALETRASVQTWPLQAELPSAAAPVRHNTPTLLSSTKDGTRYPEAKASPVGSEAAHGCPMMCAYAQRLRAVRMSPSGICQHVTPIVLPRTHEKSVWLADSADSYVGISRSQSLSSWNFNMNGLAGTCHHQQLTSTKPRPSCALAAQSADRHRDARYGLHSRKVS